MATQHPAPRDVTAPSIHAPLYGYRCHPTIVVARSHRRRTTVVIPLSPPVLDVPFLSTFPVSLVLPRAPDVPPFQPLPSSLSLLLSPTLSGPLLLTNYGFLRILFLSRALFREIPAGIKRTSSLKEERSVSLSLSLSAF